MPDGYFLSDEETWFVNLLGTETTVWYLPADTDIFIQSGNLAYENNFSVSVDDTFLDSTALADNATSGYIGYEFGSPRTATVPERFNWID